MWMDARASPHSLRKKLVGNGRRHFYIPSSECCSLSGKSEASRPLTSINGNFKVADARIRGPTRPLQRSVHRIKVGAEGRGPLENAGG